MECCANVGSYAVAPTAAAVAYVRPGQDVKLPAILPFLTGPFTGGTLKLTDLTMQSPRCAIDAGGKIRPADTGCAKATCEVRPTAFGSTGTDTVAGDNAPVKYTSF